MCIHKKTSLGKSEGIDVCIVVRLLCLYLYLTSALYVFFHFLSNNRCSCIRSFQESIYDISVTLLSLSVMALLFIAFFASAFDSHSPDSTRASVILSSVWLVFVAHSATHVAIATSFVFSLSSVLGFDV